MCYQFRRKHVIYIQGRQQSERYTDGNGLAFVIVRVSEKIANL